MASRTETIDGDAVFIVVEGLHKKLRAALSPEVDVSIDLSGVDVADVSFAQLLVSASLTARRAGKDLDLLNASPALRATFARAGIDFDPIIGRILFN